VLVGNLVANLRAMELVLATAAICLLSNRRSYLATAFVGMSIAISAYAIAMLPYGMRLGEGVLDNGYEFGNPILLGLPSALVVLLILSDRGRYFLLEKNNLGRMIVCLVAGQWLVLSGSRGSWLIAIGGLALIFAFSARSRKTILVAIGVGCLATLLALSTERGQKATDVFTRTVDADRTLNNRTSGRSSQWEALPQIFAGSPIWGYGPGSGKDIDYIYTHRHLLLHSFYLDIIVETGLMGFIPVMCVLGLVIHRAIIHLRRFGEVTPLVGVLGFMLIGMSITAFDCVSGIYLGIGFMALERSPRFVAQEYLVVTREQELARV